MAVVFPAPLGPSSPNTVPVGTWKSMPSRATTSPKRLARPSTRMAVWLMAGMLPRYFKKFKYRVVQWLERWKRSLATA
jgi:hypothetical protein